MFRLSFSASGRLFLRLFGFVMLLFFAQNCQSEYEYQGYILERTDPLPDFTLTASDGEPYSLSEAEGDYVLIYFGFTYCPDVCPMTLARLAEILDQIEQDNPALAGRVQVLMVSVDPERDTPEVLDRYMTSFRSDFIGLTAPSMAEIQPVMDEFKAFAEKEQVSTSSAGYLVNHTSRTYLVAPNRQLILQYPFGFADEHLQDDLNYLIRQETTS
jgi:protein SCO1/2